jgi:hypothetical protein
VWGPVAQSVQRLVTGWTVRGSNPGGSGYRVLHGGSKRPGRDADPHPLLVPRSIKQSRATPLLSLRDIVACKKGETYLQRYVLRRIKKNTRLFYPKILDNRKSIFLKVPRLRPFIPSGKIKV